ncbi:phosphatidylinositol 5-phosphate 4-kinase type-2 alpha-like [Homarus americanus]|uniref:1-phosphatidylinositol-5-phosphate 4-kinase n=1 Tax=Homarus americanus TaxID=6706 RepID=A0A8J5JPY1_HOMAM|nr:phosphatidylinositol 5-phosphate 4-kinase type-2 alpha-like [Homarus americanus]KAG7160173.1 Phosphatidylinositol 5-phosphate 4-kinase type-2 alpha-like [Homarus americanus]
MASASSLASKLKKKAVRVKHQKVKLFRANEPFLSVFMWGVNHTSSELSHINVPVMLMPDDFKAHSKVRVDNHLFNKENLPSHFKVKEYCPIVFRNLRERFGIDDVDFRESLTRSQPVAIDSPGRSGARFYNSYDKMYIVKTLISDEVEQMHALLKEYHPYVVNRHGKTLLPQYLAMYRLTVDSIETYCVVMRNVFSTFLHIHKKYDLKGSTVDREASVKELEKDLPTLKDNDFMKDGTKIYIGEEAKQQLMETLTADVEFLMRLHLMDYSLLLGIHDIARAEMDGVTQNESEEDAVEEEEDDECSGVPTPPDSPNTAARERATSNGAIDPDVEIYAIESNESAPQREIYFMALIDVLTHYGVKKQAAKAAKTVKYGSNADGISTVEPDQYGRRFLDFMNQAIV